MSMSEYRVKLLVGGFMIGSHFLLILLIAGLYIMRGIAFTEMTTTIGLIGPLFAGYTSVIFAFIIKNKNKLNSDGEHVNLPYAIASFFVPTVFVIALLFSVILKAWNIGFSDFENFKVMIGTIEGVFGIYVGQFVYSMFETAKPDGGQISLTVQNTNPATKQK
jgi:NADH:ubiquinone oxidoreductase subunit 6 (subunit J)